MVSIDELKPVLAKYGYKLLKVTHFKNVDRVRVECQFGFLSVNYRKHIEDYSLREVCDGLLSESQFKHEFGTGVWFNQKLFFKVSSKHIPFSLTSQVKQDTTKPLFVCSKQKGSSKIL